MISSILIEKQVSPGDRFGVISMAALYTECNTGFIFHLVTVAALELWPCPGQCYLYKKHNMLWEHLVDG